MFHLSPKKKNHAHIQAWWNNYTAFAGFYVFTCKILVTVRQIQDNLHIGTAMIPKWFSEIRGRVPPRPRSCWECPSGRPGIRLVDADARNS